MIYILYIYNYTNIYLYIVENNINNNRLYNTLSSILDNTPSLVSFGLEPHLKTPPFFYPFYHHHAGNPQTSYYILG